MFPIKNNWQGRLAIIGVILAVVVVAALGWFKKSVSEKEVQALDLAIPVYPYPVKKTFALSPVLTARSVVVLDKNSAVPLYVKNPNETLLPASTVKIMTALVVLDYFDMQQILTVGFLNDVGQQLKLNSGERLSVEELLKALLIYSANDAAQVLAQNYPGGEIDFVAAMNQKALDLGLKQTYFANPTGLDSDEQNRLLTDHSYTTAVDLAQLTRAALKNEFFRQIVATQKTTISNLDGQTRLVENLNQLLGHVRGVMGVKTGWTQDAGECLVTNIERDGHEIVITLLGSQNRFAETSQLVEWVYSNFTWQKAVPAISDQLPVGRQ
ncbi:MAG: serine hydrolase [Candidatus Shapirobacteria bacterium]